MTDIDVLVALLFLACAYAAIRALSEFIDRAGEFFNREPPPQPNAEDLKQNSVWYRAKKQELEARAEYEMAEAHLSDMRRFLKHNKLGR